MYQTTPNKSSNSLDFTNLFARLKNVHNNYNPDFATRVPLFPNKHNRQRPKSMYVCRDRHDEGEANTTARVVSTIQYGRGQGLGHRKWFSVTAKDGGFKTRCFTQVSQSHSKQSTSDKDSLKYLAISNLCLKKIRIPSQNIQTFNPKQKHPNNHIKLPIQQLTPSNKTYHRKTLRTIKRKLNINNKLTYLKKEQNNINTRIEGHKIF